MEDAIEPSEDGYYSNRSKASTHRNQNSHRPSNGASSNSASSLLPSDSKKSPSTRSPPTSYKVQHDNLSSDEEQAYPIRRTSSNTKPIPKLQENGISSCALLDVNINCYYSQAPVTRPSPSPGAVVIRSQTEMTLIVGSQGI